MLQDISMRQDRSDLMPLLALVGAGKDFGSTTVLEDVNFSVLPGEVHALVGENGAGKSTCLGLLYGLHQPSRGGVELNGKAQRIDTPSHAQSLGIGCVFQELSLAGSLSVAENIFAGRAPTKLGFVDWPELKRQAEALLAEFDLSIDVTKPVDSLPISSRQIVEIAKALSLNSRVLLLDEPTSALTPDEVQGLFKVLRNLTSKGIGIVYVSHHMSEILEISDRITVLRDGRHISSRQTSETNQGQIIGDMVGGAHPGDIDQTSDKLGQTVLEVSDLHHAEHFSAINMTVRRGEIVGLAGLLGSRRSEIVRAIAGLEPFTSGEIRLKGKSVQFKSLRQAMRHSVGFVPEERKTEGLFLEDQVGANLASASLGKHTQLGLLSRRSISRSCNQAIEVFGVKTRGPNEMIGALSGGNQQKIMLAKWLERSPDLLIIEEPTKGVDVGAKFQIHTELKRRAAEGMAIIVVSSDFPELVAVSNKILVVHEGRVTGEIAADAADEDTLLQMAAGLDVSEPAQNQAVGEIA